MEHSSLLSEWKSRAQPHNQITDSNIPLCLDIANFSTNNSIRNYALDQDPLEDKLGYFDVSTWSSGNDLSPIPRPGSRQRSRSSSPGAVNLLLDQAIDTGNPVTEIRKNLRTQKIHPQQPLPFPLPLPLPQSLNLPFKCSRCVMEFACRAELSYERQHHSNESIADISIVPICKLTRSYAPSKAVHQASPKTVIFSVTCAPFTILSFIMSATVDIVQRVGITTNVTC